jgi:hypothetical protein
VERCVYWQTHYIVGGPEVTQKGMRLIIFVVVVGLAAIGLTVAMLCLLGSAGELTVLLLLRILPLGGGLLAAAVVAEVGWIIKKRGFKRWRWDGDMAKLQAAASSVMVFACSWFVLWIPVSWLLPPRFFCNTPEFSESDAARVRLAAATIGAVLALVISLSAYWCSKRFLAVTLAADEEAGRKARRTARGILWVAAGLSAALLVFLALWFRGGMLGMLLAMTGVIPAIMFVVIGLLVRSAGWAFKSVGTVACGKWYLTISLLWLALSMSYPAGWAAGGWDVWRAKSYCQNLVPALETYKAQHGIYPTDVSQLSGISKPPRQVRSQSISFYTSNGSGYEFHVEDERLFLNWWGYSSEQPRWHIVKF